MLWCGFFRGDGACAGGLRLVPPAPPAAAGARRAVAASPGFALSCCCSRGRGKLAAQARVSPARPSLRAPSSTFPRGRGVQEASRGLPSFLGGWRQRERGGRVPRGLWGSGGPLRPRGRDPGLPQAGPRAPPARSLSGRSRWRVSR